MHNSQTVEKPKFTSTDEWINKMLDILMLYLEWNKQIMLRGRKQVNFQDLQDSGLPKGKLRML